MVLDEKIAGASDLEMQVERIVHSEAFRTSEVMRRLLLYLTERAVCGEADQLKEYTVAIEGLGKPQSYDPQHNSTARIQVGRLRQKLAEYYRTEGLRDAFIVDLPKGRFRLTCEPRVPDALASVAVPPSIVMPVDLGISPAAKPRSWLIPFAAGLTIGLLLVAAMYVTHIRSTSTASSGWSSDLEELWAPFLHSKRPLIVSIEDPLFAEVSSSPGIYYRDRSMNTWADMQSSVAVKQLAQLFGKNDIQPSRYYTAFGEAEASFGLGRLLGSQGRGVSMMRTSQLSWQQLADNNIVFVGVQNLFFEQLQVLPYSLELTAKLDGVHNLHPRAGEPAVFEDQYSTAPSEQGIMYALVTHLAGPAGQGEIESFTSVRSGGYLGATQFFENPESARMLVAKLKESNGGVMPKTFQVLLRVRFKDNVPTETTYVLNRILK